MMAVQGCARSIFFLIHVMFFFVEPLSAMTTLEDDTNEPSSFKHETVRFLYAMDYDALSELLYNHIDKKHDYLAWDWIVAQANRGIVPCCYFVARNEINKLKCTKFKHEVNPDRLLAYIIVLLMLVELDGCCWIMLRGDSKKERDNVCAVLKIFKNKIKSLIF